MSTTEIGTKPTH